MNQDDEMIFFYSPKISSLTGRLSRKIVYVPPGFGSDTLNDKRSSIYILHLLRPAHVYPGPDIVYTKDDAIDTLRKVEEVQVYKGDEKWLISKVDSAVVIKGKLFQAMTGKQYTPVLIEISK